MIYHSPAIPRTVSMGLTIPYILYTVVYVMATSTKQDTHTSVVLGLGHDAIQYDTVVDSHIKKASSSK